MEKKEKIQLKKKIRNITEEEEIKEEKKEIENESERRRKNFNIFKRK